MQLTSLHKQLGFEEGSISNIKEYSSNFDIKMLSLVINCDKHKERLRAFEKTAKEAKLKFYRNICVNGAEYSSKLIYNAYMKKLVKNTSFINPIEVSISVSHINCWLKILNSPYDYGFICEDDIIFRPNIIKNINLILNTLKEEKKNFDILYLWNGNWNSTKSSLKKVLTINKDLIIKQETRNFTAGTVSYIISRSMIEKLLKKVFPIKDPIDIFIGEFYNKAKIYTVYTKYDKKLKKDKSPLFKPGDWDNKILDDDDDEDTQTTQDYNSLTIKGHINKYKKLINK